MSSRSDAPSDTVAERDWRRLAGAASLEEFGAAWLAMAGARLGAERGVLVARREGSERFAPVAFLPEKEPCGGFLADAAERALFEARPVFVEDGARLGLAAPVEDGGRLEAIAAFEWPQPPAVARGELLARLRWGLAWIALRLGRTGSPAGRGFDPEPALRAVLAAGAYGDGARAAATAMAQALGCERIAIGDARQLAAMSHTASFDPRMELPASLHGAIVAALAAREALVHPPAPGEPVAPALAQLATDHGAGGVYCFGADGIGFCLERRAPFDRESQRAARAACALLGPVLALQRAAGEPLHRQVLARAGAGAERWLGPRAGRRRLVAAAGLLVVAWLAFGTVEFRVAGEATLEGSVRRVMTAPFDGYVAAAHARAGDIVKTGAPIAALDDRDLRLERVRWVSQHAQYARQLQEAAARHDRGQMQILQAQLAQAEAQVQLLDEQLRRAALAAPFDGVIVSGDLSQSVGAVVRKGETLFEIAPLAGYRVVVDVDESEIASVAAGQRGTVLLAAIAERSFPITVTSVTPVARTKEGRNTFRVEAALDVRAERLRPGMEGVAKIETGPRNVVWIWTHRFTNWLRLQLWSLWP